MKRKIIYAVYGSNLLKERFLAYIRGGTYKGHQYNGCRDKTEPIDRGWMFIPHRLYFAKESPRWGNKGVAFISCEKEADRNYHAIARLWEITEEQFEDIWEEEGKAWYHKKLCLGIDKGLKILTLTGCWLEEMNNPSEEYLNVIKAGLKETTNWDDGEIEKYLNKFLVGRAK